LNILWTAGWRFDLRREHFVPYAREGAVATYDQQRSGYAERNAVFLSPNTFRLNENYAFMPYTIANVGGSYIERDAFHTSRSFQWTWGWGIGLQGMLHNHDVFVEEQKFVRAGGYAGQWQWSAGWLWPLGR
jgi:hypothetical protein